MNKKFILGVVCFLLLVMTLQGANAALIDGLVRSWRLDNSSLDDIGLSNLSYNGAPTNTTGKINAALNISSGKNFYDANVYSHNAKNGTYAFWLKSAGTTGYIMERKNSAAPCAGFQMYGNADGTLTAYTSVTSATTTMSVLNNQWNHIVITWDNSRMVVYVNGSVNVNVSSGYPSACVVETLATYNNNAPTDSPFVGIFDEILIYNRTLTSTEAGQLYNLGLGLAYPFTEVVYNITFISQTPSDITSTNLFSQRLNITYNINLSNQNATYPLLNYSLTNGNIFYNGTQVSSSGSQSSTSNSSYTFSWTVSENAVLPGTYNLNETIYSSTTHISSTIAGTNDLALIELQNINASASFNYFEVMLNTSGANPSDIFFCNSSYTIGQPDLSVNCHQFASFSGTGFNHSHNSKSYHNVFSLPIVAGKVDTVTVTSTSYFIIKGVSGVGDAFLGYVPNVSRSNVSKTSNNGGLSWTDQSASGTPDVHLHQFNTNTAFNYVVCGANSTTYECSTTRSDTIQATPLPPSSPQITSPVENQNVTRYLNVTWEASIPFNSSTTITNYNLTLLNNDLSTNITINASVGNGTYFYFDTYNLGIRTGTYYVKVEAKDSLNATAYSISPLFNHTTDGYLNITAINAFNGANVTNFTINASSGSYSFNGSYSNTTKSAQIDIVRGVSYFVFIDAPTYSYANITLLPNNSITNYQFGLYTNNSILIRIFSEDTGFLLSGTNVTVITSGAGNFSITNYTTTGTLFVDNLPDDTYNIKFTSENYTLRTYTVTVTARSTQTLNAFLTAATNTVILTTRDILTGLTVEDVSITQYRVINSTLTAIETKATDITGRAQFVYTFGYKYTFQVSKTGYDSKLFSLDPILFSSYDISLDRTIVEQSSYSDVYIDFTPNYFSNNQTTNFSFIFNSANGVLSSYNLSVVYPGGSYNGTGSLANGQTFQTVLNITGATLTSVVFVNFTYSTVFGELKSATYVFLVTGGIASGQLANIRNNTYGMGIFERILIATLILIFGAGIASIFAGRFIGLIIGLVCLLFLGMIGFVPWAYTYITILMGILLAYKIGGSEDG